jgi:SAM-dependent methyltransferase
MGLEISRFWNERAEEDAFFFVDNRMAYGRADLERFWANGERELDALLVALGETIDASADVIEIGCGVGRLTRVISARARSVRALDVSERMLELAKRHNPHLANVDWLLGDGSSLAGIESQSGHACISHVVFQHIPDPEITLSYVREIGRVLKPGGWAAFQISNDPRVHAPLSAIARARNAALAAIGRGPHAQHDPRWLGSMVELDALRRAAIDGSMAVERVVGEGTQFCAVLTRRS